MMQPTREQIERVARWAGFTWELYPTQQKRWLYPDGSVLGLYPPDLTDLSTLFRWVVPKLNENGVAVHIDNWSWDQEKFYAKVEVAKGRNKGDYFW